MKYLLLAVVAMGAAAAGATPDSPKTDAKNSLAAFNKRAKEYVALRNKLAGDVGRLTDKSSPEQIAEHKVKLRERVRAQRANAQPGEILGAGIFEVVSAVRSETAGKKGSEARDAILGDGNPVKEGKAFTPKVNGVYPDDAPRSTVTPDVLAKLPKLPEGLEFRFVGRTLILYDSETDLIVDYVQGVVKGTAKQ